MARHLPRIRRQPNLQSNPKGALPVSKNPNSHPPVFYHHIVEQLYDHGLRFLHDTGAGPFIMQSCGFTKLETAQVLLSQNALNAAAIPLLTTFGKKNRHSQTRCHFLIRRRTWRVSAAHAGRFWSWQGGIRVRLRASGFKPTAGATCAFAQFRTYFPRDLFGTAIGTRNMIWPALAAVLGYVFGLAFEDRTSSWLEKAFSPCRPCKTTMRSLLALTSFFGSSP